MTGRRGPVQDVQHLQRRTAAIMGQGLGLRLELGSQIPGAVTDPPNVGVSPAAKTGPYPAT